MIGVVEKSVQEATREMAKGIKKFMAEYPASNLSIITFVVCDCYEPLKIQLEKDLRS
jgi:hypothetical protein